MAAKNKSSKAPQGQTAKQDNKTLPLVNTTEGERNEATTATPEGGNEVSTKKGNAMATKEHAEVKAEAATATNELSQAQQERFDVLVAKLGTALGHSDEEDAEFLELNKVRRAGIQVKRNAIAKAVDAFDAANVTFAVFYKEVVAKNDGKRAEITSLFSKDEILAAARSLAPAGEVAQAHKSDKDEAEPGNKVALITYKKAGSVRGKSTSFNQDQKLASPQAAFRELWESDKKNFAENLTKYYTPAGAEYFETEEGKKLLAYFIKQTTRDVSAKAAVTATPAAAGSGTEDKAAESKEATTA